MRRTSVLSTIIVCAVFLMPPADGMAAPSKCDAAKVKAAGRKVAAKAKCRAGALQKDVPVDAQCLANAEQKFETAFSKADTKNDNCTNIGDSAAVEATVDVCVDDLVAQVKRPPFCDRAQDCPEGDVCTDAACVDVGDGTAIWSLIASSYLDEQCLPRVMLGGGPVLQSSADACYEQQDTCTGCPVDIVPDVVSVTVPSPETWATAPALDIHVQFDASSAGPVDYSNLGIPGSCLFELSRTDVAAIIGVSFAEDGTATATVDIADLRVSAKTGCSGAVPPLVTDAVTAVDVELTDALEAQIEAVRLALEQSLQP